MKITVRAGRPDGGEKYRWPAQVLARDGGEIVVAGVFGRGHRVADLDISPGDTTVEHYLFGKWYNICRLYRSGTLLGIYCNLATPPELRARTLSFVDLELDLLVYPDGRFVELDRGAFEQLSTRSLSAGAVRAAMADWARLIAQVEKGERVFAETKRPAGDRGGVVRTAPLC